jgi:U4/U6.U5 tri-snRNP-associated protein 1
LFSSEIEDKHARRDRYTSEPTTEFKEKDNYRPDIKLAYVDDSGRKINEKEAFRFLSYRFHNKASGKKKTEKRVKKQVEEEVKYFLKQLKKIIDFILVNEKNVKC